MAVDESTQQINMHTTHTLDGGRRINSANQEHTVIMSYMGSRCNEICGEVGIVKVLLAQLHEVFEGDDILNVFLTGQAVAINEFSTPIGPHHTPMEHNSI